MHHRWGSGAARIGEAQPRVLGGQPRDDLIDGIEDFGYATNNAGWIKRDDPVVTWSPDSRKLATFQHDGRGVSMMYLVRTQVGEPELEAWRYPLPGDSVIFRVHRVVIDLDGPNGPLLIRLRMPPDQHRSMVSGKRGYVWKKPTIIDFNRDEDSA